MQINLIIAGIVVFLVFGLMLHLSRKSKLKKALDAIDVAINEDKPIKATAEPQKTCEIDPDKFNRLRPIDQLADYIRSTLDKTVYEYNTGDILFSIGDPVKSLYYLIEGTVYLELYDDSEGYEISAASHKALYPLSVGDKYVTNGYAKTRVKVLKVKREILAQLTPNNHLLDAKNDLRLQEIPDKLRYSALFNGFCEHLQKDKLNLPSLPHVSLKLSKAIDKENIGINDAVKIVQMDAAIAAKLIQVANSPLYRVSDPIATCLQAVNRLGLSTTRNLVLSSAMSNLYRCKNRAISNRLMQVWENSLLISSMCYVLATRIKGINPDEALLAGLVSDIGIVPFLHYAAELPKSLYSLDELESCIPLVRAPVGAYLLKQWGFPEALQVVPKLSEDWYHQSGNNMTLSDIVILSKLHSYIGTDKMAQAPFINAVPAYSKLSDDALTPEFSLDVLHRSKTQIQEIIKHFQIPR